MSTDGLNPPLVFHRVRKLRPSAPAIADIAAAVRAALEPVLASHPLPAGARVAVTCGSRGIKGIAGVAAAACATLRAAGADPFIIPGMGSHGNATADGQRRVLRDYGITEETTGVPVLSSLDTVHLGATPDGVDVFMDRNAYEAGRVLVLNRVKPHTTFDGEHESGLFKMMSVGLGKLDGARSFHRNSMRLGFAQVLLAMGRLSAASGKVWAGLGLVENDEHRLAHVDAAPAAGIEALDKRLLLCARKLYSRLPFSELDLLILDEIGKNIAGTGMDTKVVGRMPHLDGTPLRTEGITQIRRIYARDLTPQSEGNATGMGLADIIHRRIFEKAHLPTTYTNGRTALAFRGMRLPMHFASDVEALDFLLANLGSPSAQELRAARVRNTLAVSDFLATPACLPELDGDYEVGAAAEAKFSAGELL